MTLDIKDIRSNEDLSNPQGKNDLDAEDLFYWRSLYKSFIYPSELARPSIDLWYDNFFYGKIDDNGLPVYLSENSLKQLPSDEKTLFALNFVVDAYQDFKEFMLASAKSGKINTDNSQYQNLEPIRAWDSVHNLHYEWVSTFYQSFSTTFVNSARDRQMADFKGYTEVYIDFVNTIIDQFPFTREKWMISGLCPPTVSGLIIEISDRDLHGDDQAKYKYLSDNNFYFVSRAAEQFGFKIDKNAPWRFVADLDSPVMAEYMSRYDYTRENLFQKAYFKTCQYDYDVFKRYVWSWYNEYITFNPMVDKIVTDRCTGDTKSELAMREKVGESDYNNVFSESYWIRMYAFVRGKEENKKWTQVEFDKLVAKLSEIVKYKSRDDAMAYLYRQLTKGRSLEQKIIRDDLTQAELDAIMLKNQIEGTRRGSFQL